MVTWDFFTDGLDYST